MAIMSVILGAKMNLRREKLIKLCIAALLKDIVLVSSKVEKNIKYAYKQHPILGYEYLKKNYSLDEEILLAILHDHEQFDGLGYPNKLEDEEISSFARIIAFMK